MLWRYSPAGQFLAGQSLAGVMAAVLVLVLAPVGDGMGQAGRHDAVCDHCGGAGDGLGQLPRLMMTP